MQDSFDTNFQVFDESFGTQNQNGVLLNFPGSNCGGTHDDHFSENTQDQDLQKTVLMNRNSSPERGNGSRSKSKKHTVKGNRSDNFENIGSRNLF